MAKEKTLYDLFVRLKSVYYAQKRIPRALPKVERGAGFKATKKALAAR